MAKARFHERLGAFGVTAALGLTGAGALVRSCSVGANKPAVRLRPAAASVSPPLAVAGDVLDIVNEERAAAGLPTVSEVTTLDAASAEQSLDQAQRQTMTHTGADGSTAGTRIEGLGYRWTAWGENVAAGQTTAEEVMDAWMNSAGHRANILNPTFTNIGVAAVRGANGVVYWTMDLAATR